MINLIWAFVQAFIIIGVIAAISMVVSHMLTYKESPGWFTRWLDEQERKFHDHEM